MLENRQLRSSTLSISNQNKYAKPSRHAVHVVMTAHITSVIASDTLNTAAARKQIKDLKMRGRIISINYAGA